MVLLQCKIFRNLSKNTPLEENNTYYCSNLPEFLATNYMSICPLWTGLIIGPSKFPEEVNATFTNSVAENWMRIVKNNILNEESKLRPGDFIRRMYEGISGRIKAFDFAFLPINCKVIKRTKFENNNIIDDSQIEEIWERRKKSVDILNHIKYRKQEVRFHRNVVEKNSPNLIKRIPNTWRLFHQTLKNSNELSSDDSIFEISDIKLHSQGQFCLVDSRWQRQKCK